MTYMYDAIAMAQPSNLDPYRVACTLTFATTDEDDTHADGTAYVGTVDHMIDGPRGAVRFARMYAYACATGITPDPLADALAIRIGSRGQRGIDSPAGQRQMLSILRWLLACAGHGEDVLQASIMAALEAGDARIGAIMAHTPSVIETIEWARREPPRDHTPIEWLE